MEEFAIEVEGVPSHPDARVAHIEGELDVATTPEAREELDRQVEEGAIRVVLDLAETSFMDSSAIGMCLGMSQRLRSAGGGLAIAAAGPGVRTAMDLAGVRHVLSMHEDVDSALAALGVEDAD
jgi:anti-sigma B factor antagonist